MQLKITLIGGGVGIPKTNLGVGFVNIGYLFFRHGKGADVKSLRIVDMISLGQKSGAFLGAVVETSWFELDPNEDNWAYNINWLIGKKIEVELSGFQILRGETDISLKFFDEYNKPKELVNRCCTKANGIQFSSIKIRAIVERGTLDSNNAKFD